MLIGDQQDQIHFQNRKHFRVFRVFRGYPPVDLLHTAELSQNE